MGHFSERYIQMVNIMVEKQGFIRSHAEEYLSREGDNMTIREVRRCTACGWSDLPQLDEFECDVCNTPEFFFDLVVCRFRISFTALGPPTPVDKE